MLVLQYIVLILVVLNTGVACYEVLGYGCNTKDEMIVELSNILSKLLLIALIFCFIFR